MLELTETKIKKWSAEIGIVDLGLSAEAFNVIVEDIRLMKI